MRIGLRILLGYFLIVALAAFLLMRVFTQEIKPGVRQAMEDTLADTANVLAELATDDFLAGRIDDGRFAARVRALGARDIGANIWGFRKSQAEYRVYVTDAAGTVVFDSAGRDLGRDYSRWNDVLLTLRGQYGARSTRSDPDDDSTSVMHVAAPIRDGRRIVGVLTVAKPNSAIAPFIARSERTILRWGFVLLGTALAVGLLAAWWLSRQLGGLRRYADAVTAGELARLPDAAGEFADLGRALETMRERLEGKQYVERYVHALTHELKAPLSAIRGAAELLETPLPDADRRRFAATVVAQGERMTQMIDKLLALAAVEHRQRIEQPDVVPVAAMLEAALAPFRDDPRRVPVHLVIDADCRDTVVVGDAFLLRQMVANLVDNACDFAPADSAVTVTLAPRAGDRIAITVDDQGPGVPAYALDRVFERFYSLPRPHGGSRSSGIGLAFVAEVAALHGGRAALANRDGGGAVATIELPRPSATS
ncbi:two-component system sensor histidine kinase CreC [Lysobacteraceae bacterium NML93-0792]|nr:two-component system sensor histidine kinase CreC [Xanthomonadaceae bacterium NML93-0792]PBS16511.1 two-component system sensor histidine kinase CreC [Xanthomonadaceae bacterium NML93-0793]PBS19886.1 two-component system sensor histidine kinase CreC [Xanthomonadaceae bacterium NML93-0831]